MPDADTLRPRLVLRFGVTGHRPPRFAREHHDAAMQTCREIFARSEDILSGIFASHSDTFASDKPQVRLVSALADGADIVAAEAAIAQGASLSACLPFPAKTYRNNFAEEDWRKAEKLSDAATSTMSLQDHSGGDDAAYEAIGRLVLAQADILLAIWDGDVARGRGGTGDVVAAAVAAHIPVIHIAPDGDHEPVLMWSGLHDEIPDRPSVDGVLRVPLQKALPTLIDALCAPPEGEEFDALKDFLKPARPGRETAFAWPLLLAAAGSKKWSKISFRVPSLADARGYLDPLTRPFAEMGRFGEALNGRQAARFSQADATASLYALRFRSSFVTNFSLAALAVLLALSGLLFPDAKVWLISAELVVIFAIIMNTRSANRSNFHKLWIDRRHLAERLRLLMISASLGRLSLRDVEDGTTHPGWVTWYVRACARELELPPGEIDQAYLAKVRDAALELMQDQISYHENNSHLMEHTNHRLHVIGDYLFIGTILFCGVYLTVKLGTGAPMLMGIDLTGVVTLATAFFPALAAALYGIRMQGDFAATAERSALIARRMKKLHASLESDTLTYNRMVDRVRRLSEIMLSDVQQWQQQYETRPISLPG
ncbi:hypothetical protein BPTFM16_00002 [Altererythrobacter insulae]|nr:hypothetical protein BPTFM16_00002 [Altererythrobacter insulae]